MSISSSADRPSVPRWVPIGRACEILGVNQATLRQWTSQGRVKAFVTPGGHRRYLEDDLQALTRSGARPNPARSLKTLLLAARQRYQTLARQCWQEFAWFQSLEEETRLRYRVLGHSMLNLLSEYVLAETSSATRLYLEEAEEVAAQYGAEAAHLGLSAHEATQAFLIFRTPVLESINHWLAGNADPRSTDRLRRFNHFMDQVLVSMVTAHEARLAPSPGRSYTERITTV